MKRKDFIKSLGVLPATLAIPGLLKGNAVRDFTRDELDVVIEEAEPLPPGKYAWVMCGGGAMNDYLFCLFSIRGKVVVGDMVYLDKDGYVRKWHSRLGHHWLGLVQRIEKRSRKSRGK